MAQSRTLAEVQEQLRQFREDRDWGQFHSLSNLASSISVEAAELLELFLWSPPVTDAHVLEQRHREVEAELADVVIQCLNFAQVADIDVLAAVARKIQMNGTKYPVDRAKGSAAKYSEL